MAHGYDTMMTPAIEELLDRTESKFVLVTLAAMRSREITNYLGQLGGRDSGSGCAYRDVGAVGAEQLRRAA